MGKYTDSQCIICQKPFAEEDDIVVCPDCGTPYHRDCWNTQGKCINTALHAVGGSWTAQQQEQRLHSGGRICPHCEYVNHHDAQRCESCGGELESNEQQQPENEEHVRIPLPGGGNAYFDLDDPCCGLPPTEKIEEETLGDVASFVRTNTLYYIPLFRRFRDSGRKISLNFSCILFPHLYFAYRKMWSMAIISSLILIICGLPAALIGMLTSLTTPEFMESMTQLYGEQNMAMFDGLTEFLRSNQSLFESLYIPLYLVNIAARIIFCLFGNHLYYGFVLDHVGRIRSHSPNEHVRHALLSSEGGTSFWNILGCCAIYYGVVFALYFVLMLVFVS